ncbi:amino acid ABC transporter permease [Roseospira marina]|uniref:Amino acid ABC transporter permease n=1 Tax=Roseospira marina TaxID=140057 RepID=A0A5M6IBL1_9PROT|nr:amino acid ABC transporter permease [Roseospira marina]KAA5604998.1 amino acid ABC transporter permease [Roseospira marina]MBB4314996.1 general L-amino acid transport system permease protein [Roseospira marina]MBB5087996.1 general L-amino acid transport system permease protein [Roseospira marina]
MAEPAAPRTPAPWNNPRIRALVFQGLALVLVLWFFWTIFQNTLTNMESRGITTGFGFLDNTAGFGILFSLIPYDEADTYGRTFIVGILNTLLVSGLGIVFATVIGFVLGVARLSNNWLIAKIALVYIEITRNIPPLLMIFFWYFAVLRTLPSPRGSLEFPGAMFLNNRGLYIPWPHPEPGFWVVGVTLIAVLVGAALLLRWSKKRQDETGVRFPAWPVSVLLVIGLPTLVFLLMGSPVTLDRPELKGFNFRGGVQLIPELISLWLALTIYTAAFIGEIVRSGIESVSHGQTEASQALGLSRGKTLRLIIIPQAMRVIIPPLTSEYLNLTKNSSLATAIGYPDLVAVFMGTTLNQTGQAVEIVAMTMAVYLSISLIISLLMNLYNRAVALKER